MLGLALTDGGEAAQEIDISDLIHGRLPHGWCLPRWPFAWSRICGQRTSRTPGTDVDDDGEKKRASCQDGGDRGVGW